MSAVFIKTLIELCCGSNIPNPKVLPRKWVFNNSKYWYFELGLSFQPLCLSKLLRRRKATSPQMRGGAIPLHFLSQFGYWHTHKFLDWHHFFRYNERIVG